MTGEPRTMAASVRVRSLQHSYGEHRVVRGMDFVLQPGRMVPAFTALAQTPAPKAEAPKAAPQQEKATQTVLERAEVLSELWAAA